MKSMNKTVEAIAKKHFQIETMEVRNMDSLDFYEVSITSIREALTEAYQAGVDSVNPKKDPAAWYRKK